MTSKEALEKIGEYPVGNFGIFTTYNKFKEEFDTIKKDLERLEELEIENQDLKDNEKIIADYGYNLVIENEKLKKANECLTKQNQELVEKIKKYEREQYKQIR